MRCLLINQDRHKGLPLDGQEVLPHLLREASLCLLPSWLPAALVTRILTSLLCSCEPWRYLILPSTLGLAVHLEVFW